MRAQLKLPGRCRLLLPETATVDEWLHARTKGIGGSEVAALLGISPYSTAFDVFKAKIDETGAIRSLAEEPTAGPKIRAELLTDNVVFEWGHRLEEAVALKTADEKGLIARPGGGLYQHLDHPIAIVTPDRIGTRARSRKPVALIECKTSAETTYWEDGIAPIHYQVQAQWQMGITGIHTCYVGCFVLNFDRDFFCIKVEFDEAWFNEMVAISEQFWRDHVLTGEPPMHDYTHSRTTDLLKELHPHVIFESIQLGEGAREWIETYHQAKKTADAADAALEEAKNWLRVQLGDAGAGYIGDDKVVSYPEIHSMRISSKKLRDEYPEIAEKCSEPSSYRRMTVRKIKQLGKVER